ncbi:MAG: CDP-alcohol phosphatidyltransferase family protein [Candidatus Woesearchaeota archaeon]
MNLKERYNKIKEHSFSRARKYKGFDKIYDTFMRVITFIPVFILSFFPITGNAVSILAILGNFLAFYLFITQQFILGIIIIFATEVLDYMDGTVARIRNEKNPIMGSFLGRLYHVVSFGIIFIGICIGIGIWEMGIVLGISYYIRVYMIELRNSLLNIVHKDIQKPEETKKQNKLYKFIKNLIVFPISDGKVIILIILISIILGILKEVMIFYAIHSVILALAVFVITYRQLIAKKKEPTENSNINIKKEEEVN